MNHTYLATELLELEGQTTVYHPHDTSPRVEAVQHVGAVELDFGLP